MRPIRSACPNLVRLEDRHAPATFLDYTFGTDGVARLDALNSVVDVVGLPDGRVIAVGPVTSASGKDTDFGISRLTADGKVDTTFGTGGTVVVPFDLGGQPEPGQIGKNNDVPVRVSVLPDGRIVVAGDAIQYVTIPAPGFPGGERSVNATLVAVARLTAAGALDSSFDTDGRTTFSWTPGVDLGDLTEMAALTDGAIVLAGNTHDLTTGIESQVAARLTTGGQLDPTYGTAGRVTFDHDVKVAVPDLAGRVAYVTAKPSSPSGSTEIWSVRRLAPDGTPDAGFGEAGEVPLGVTPAYQGGGFRYALPTRPDGGYLAIVQAIGISSGDDFSASSLSESGVIDPVFGTNGRTDLISEFTAVFPDDRIVSIAPRYVVTRFGVTRRFDELQWLTAAGQPDTRFGDNGVTMPGGGPRIDPAGRVLIPSIRDDGAGGTFGVVTRLPADPNRAPTISPIPDQTLVVGTTYSPISFTVGDAESPADQVTVTITSSDESLIPASGVIVGGTSADRTLTITPVPGRTGSVTLTVIAQDPGGQRGFESFTVRVNAPPTISPMADFRANVGQSIGLFPFTVGDSDTQAEFLGVEVATSNPALVSPLGLTLTGTGANRALTVTPVAGAIGKATITITVRDLEGLTTTESFLLTINPAGSALGDPVLVGYPQFGVGGATTATLYNPDQSVRFSIEPFGNSVGGVRTAAADFNRDGVADLVVGTGPGVATQVRVLNGVSQALLFTLDPFESSFTGGVHVAAGDVTGDGVPDLVVTPDEGGGPRVRVFDGQLTLALTIDGKGFFQVADFFGIDDPNFRGGARAAIGDVNGDGVGDLVVAAGFQGGPRVAGYSGPTLMSGPVKLFGDFFAFEESLRNGVFVAAGDLDGDGFAEVIAGGGPGGGPRITAFSGKQLLANTYDVRANFFGGDEANRGGIRVAVKDLDGDTRADLVVGAGTGAGSRVTGYSGTNIGPSGTPPTAFSFDAFAGFSGGVFVG